MATQRLKITQAACEKTPPNSKLWDTEIKGFGLFSGKTTKTFYYQREVRGKTVRIKLGNFPQVSAGIARGDVLQLAADHASGLSAKRLNASKIPTLEQALETYVTRPKLRSERNKRQIHNQMHRHLKTWLPVPLDEITKADCVNAHARVSQTGGPGANHVLRSFRSIYNHARRTHELPECPTIAIEWNAEAPSLKIIDDLDQWKAEVAALKNPVHQAYYRFLLLTGMRREETRSLRWDQVFDDHLHLPVTKNGRAFDLPLLPEHHAILEPMRMYKSDFVFHGRWHTDHVKDPIHISWSAHAHRRTFATIATTDALLFEETVGRLLNHTPRTVTGSRYVIVDHKRLKEPMRQVVEAFKRVGI